MFAIEVQSVFTATHALRLPGGGVEDAHAHDWQVTVRVSATKLDALETVMDFHLLQQALERIIAPWRGAFLNSVNPFDAAINPSAERVAERIAELLRPAVTAPARLVSVRVTEAPDCAAFWLVE